MSHDTARGTPLYPVHARLGASFFVFDDFSWPNHYGDPVAEHAAVVTHAGIFDSSAMPKLDVRGPDALAALDWVFTTDMQSLEVGQARYGLFCDADGKLVSDGIVYKFGDERAWVTTTLESDREHIEGLVGGYDVSIEPFTDDVVHVALQGPSSRALLAGLCASDVAGLRYFRFWPDWVDVAGVSCFVTRTGYSGQLGYELFCGVGDAERLWESLVEAGATPYGLAALELLRIEAGLMFIGRDYTPHETSPYDVSWDRAVTLDRGEFHGRAALAETATSPLRRMKTLVLEDDEVPEYGAAVFAGGARVGTLTSPCRSPAVGAVIGLAILEAEFAVEGTTVEVAVGDRLAPATVGTLPIVDPERKRPRG